MPNRRNSAFFIVSKEISLADEPVDISVESLKRWQDVTLHAMTSLPGGTAVFESFAHYAADEQGCVLLNEAISHGGTYEGIEPMGLFWSMVPSPFNKRQHERFLWKKPSQPFTVKLSVYDGHIKSLEGITAVPLESHLATTEIRRTYMAPGVQEFDIREGRVRAVLYLPPGDGPFPGVLSFSGGYPGVMKHKAALLASRGFAALGLKFFGVDDLPDQPFEDMDLTYFEEAAMLLKNHPKVDGGDGVGIVANCSGAWIALGLASCAPAGLLKCVVGVSGFFYPTMAFRYKGRTWTDTRGWSMDISTDQDGITIWNFTDTGIDIAVPGNVFDFHKRHETAYMLVYAGNDGYYDMKQISSHAKTLLESSGHRDSVILFYPGAGHLIEHRYSPLAKIAWTFSEPHFNGGEQPYHAKAEMDSWPKILSFLHERLAGGKKNVSKL